MGIDLLGKICIFLSSYSCVYFTNFTWFVGNY